MSPDLNSDDPSTTIDQVGNYANSTLRDRLLRVPGVGGAQVFGGGDYAITKLAARGLVATFAEELAPEVVEGPIGHVVRVEIVVGIDAVHFAVLHGCSLGVR